MRCVGVAQTFVIAIQSPAAGDTVSAAVRATGSNPARDVPDTRVVRALAHPIRVAALALLEERVLSPTELSEQLGVTLPLISYHVRQLKEFGLIKLVRTAPRRGTVQHYYRAKPRPKGTGHARPQVPMIVKREMVGDERCGEQVSKLLAKTLERVERIQADAAERLAKTHAAGTRRTTVVLMLFEGPNPS